MASDIATKDGARVRLYSRLRSRPVLSAARRWHATSAAFASFDRIRYRRNDACVFLYAFYLIGLNGDDLRRGGGGGLGPLVPKRRHSMRERCHHCASEGN
jgi:hypothetical protein